MKTPIYQYSMLWDVQKGLHKIVTVYSDGSEEIYYLPLSPPVIVSLVVI